MIIITSDFKRARESAEIASEILGSRPILRKELRERFFGDFEGKPNSHYEDVWRDDANDPNHTNHNVESANSVLDRTTKLISEYNAYWQNLTFLLVSHGDALQILQTGFHKVPASKHRSLPHLATAEVRELTLAT
jgi:probable phosphoglycerate mutase